MSTPNLAQRLAAFPELAGETITRWRDGLKAQLAFTRFSRLLGHDPAQYDRQQRNLARLGRLLLALNPLPLAPALSRDLAMMAEGLGDENGFAVALRRAFRDAERYEKQLALKPRRALALCDFHISMMDFSSARRVALAVADVMPDESAEMISRIDALEAECAPWRPVVDAASRALRARVAPAGRPEPQTAIALHVPVAAFRRNIRDYAGFREDIRHAFQVISQLLAEEGIAYTVTGRIAKHGVPQGSAPFISYHTVNGDRPGFHLKETDRRGYFSGDTGGYSGWAAFADIALPVAGAHDRSAVEAFIASERAALIGGNQSKYLQPETDSGERHDGRPFVFVALQVIDDAVQRQACLHMFDMLEEVAATCRRRNIAMVVKRHPLCRSRAVAHVLAKGERRGLFTVASGSIHALIAGSCAVCVINSGVGAEALLHGKPVYCFGRAEYQAAAFKVRARGDFERLFTPNRLPAPIEQIEDFLYALRHVYSVDVRDEPRAREFWRGKIRQLVSETARL